MRKVILSPGQQESRAKNVVADFLFRHLIVPKVFFDAAWPSRSRRVDVLAIDRSGTGEIHVVEIKVGTGLKELNGTIAQLEDVPAHFKYIALFENRAFRPDSRTLYAADGMGRIGVIQVKEDAAGNLSAEYSVRPERFKLDSSIFKAVDRFTANRQPNLEIRP